MMTAYDNGLGTGKGDASLAVWVWHDLQERLRLSPGLLQRREFRLACRKEGRSLERVSLTIGSSSGSSCPAFELPPRRCWAAIQQATESRPFVTSLEGGPLRHTSQSHPLGGWDTQSEGESMDKGCICHPTKDSPRHQEPASTQGVPERAVRMPRSLVALKSDGQNCYEAPMP